MVERLITFTRKKRNDSLVFAVLLLVIVAAALTFCMPSAIWVKIIIEAVLYMVSIILMGIMCLFHINEETIRKNGLVLTLLSDFSFVLYIPLFGYFMILLTENFCLIVISTVLLSLLAIIAKEISLIFSWKLK